ncbi:MAG: YihY family inner membrane protein, partial [Proteobacteria bacterium]|nr:YihY family inner membrane protein [Pseudomonadota bacterium]
WQNAFNGVPAAAARVGAMILGLADLLRYTAVRFHRDRCAQAAAALTFTSLLALVPLMAIVFASLAAFAVFGDVREELQAFIFESFVPHVGDVVSENLSRFAENAGRLTVVGSVVLGVTALMLLLTIQDSFNRIWRVAETRPPWVRWPAYWTLLSLGPLLLAASFSLSTYLFAAARSIDVDALTGPLAWIAESAPMLLTTAALCPMYALMPNFPVQWRHAMVGGLAAAGCFEVLKRGFALYVANFPSYEIVYGAMAAFPLFLVWAYLSWVVVLLGAELTASLPEWRRRPVPR